MRYQLQAAPQLACMRNWPGKHTPLQYACGLAGPHVVSMVGLLLEHGADVHAQICSLGKPAHVHWHLPLHKVVRVHVDRCCTIPEAFDFHRRG